MHQIKQQALTCISQATFSGATKIGTTKPDKIQITYNRPALRQAAAFCFRLKSLTTPSSNGALSNPTKQ